MNLTLANATFFDEVTLTRSGTPGLFRGASGDLGFPD
jgi:hypothetical protein